MPRPVTLRETWDYRRAARWWELEACRGYPSSADSAHYARNMRWAQEFAREFGPGTWLELVARSTTRTPDERTE